MATRNIVPRADGEGKLGTTAKKWGEVHATGAVTAGSVTTTGGVSVGGDVSTNTVNGNNADILFHPRKNSTAYAVGDIAFGVSAPSAIALLCITAGTTAAAEPDFSSATVGDTVTDGTAVWRYQSIIGGDGIPLGMVAPFLQTSIPDGWLSCENGQVVLRSAYPELWAWVQTNAPLITEAQWQTKAAAQKSVGYYSDGDGSTTFRLPRLVGFMEGTTAANVGAFTAAGLPNITGGLNTVLYESSLNQLDVDGAFYAAGAQHTLSMAGTTFTVPSYTPVVTGFSASRSSAIYGASNTVQPESVGMVWCVRAFGAAVNQGTVDITALAQSLNLKASLALDNLSQAGEDHFLGDDNFTIIYPNGGTAANPANITVNSRYVDSNPFPGYRVFCQCEIKINNQWGNPEFQVIGGDANGVKSNQLDDDTIITQSGTSYLSTSNGAGSGNPFGNAGINTSAPCRVKVWKIGKVANS